MDDLEALLAQMLAGGAETEGLAELQHYADTAPGAAERLRLRHPVRTASAFAALLLDPRMQGSTLRLETLVHLSLAVGATGIPPAEETLCEAFADLGEGSLSDAEADSDQLFVGMIRTARGGFRILEGNWTAQSFYVQRFVNIVEAMPEGNPYDLLREAVYALLAISDLVCARADLRRYTPGQFEPQQALPPDIARQALSRPNLVKLSDQDLADLGLDRQVLAPFTHAAGDRTDLLLHGWGDTPLEQRPIVGSEGALYLVLPTAVSLAIRHFVLGQIFHWDFKAEFVTALANEHKQWFSQLRTIGTRKAENLRFHFRRGAGIASLGLPVDPGRILQILFVLDDLEGFETGGFSQPNPRPNDLADAIETMIGIAHDHATAADDFRDGLTLIVVCGIGRPTNHAMPEKRWSGWRTEIIGAADLETLTQLRGFGPRTLWQLLEAKDRMSVQGARLYLPAGLLQLVGQTRGLEGHLVDHGQLPDGCLDEDKTIVIQGDPYALLRVRHEAAENWDLHVVRDVDGRAIKVSRENLPIFDEDRGAQSYIEEELPLRGVFETERRSWWWLVDTDSEDISARHYRWQTLATWVARTAPVLEARFPDLPDGPIEWRARFDADLQPARIDEGAIDLEQARACLTASGEPGSRILHTRATAEYEKAFSAYENLAEQALVEALIKAVALMAGSPLSVDDLQDIAGEIIPGPHARQTHAFRHLGFRDYVRSSLAVSTTRIELEDDATSRVGVGWMARERSQGAWIEGKAECRAYLNKLVTCLEDAVIADLRTFDRRKMIEALLRNHETGALDTEDWKRTAAANLALHEDKLAVLRTLGERESKLSAVSLTCRILLEIAACECPLEGGLTPGKLDLSRLMSRTSQIFHFGGDSDAVHWDAMSPRIRVTPLGDVHANRDFVDAIVEPYGRRNADIRFEDAVDDYERHFEIPEPTPAGQSVFEPEFLVALEETLGAPYAAFRIFLEFLEDMGVKAGRAILLVKRSQLLAVKTDIGELDTAQARAVIDALTFIVTPGYRKLPPGYVGADRHPWRFRRQLSVLRRPLIPVDDGEDPLIAAAPALVRQAWIYLINNYHRGDFADGHLGPKLANWKKKTSHQRGQAFTQKVADRLSAAGWTTYPELKMTKLLKRGLERDYGDIDVLAYHPKSGRALAIECKDVQYRKTYGEVAEQLADFRGGLNAKGKPDYLLRHLDRMELTLANLDAVRGFLGVADLASVESHLVFRNPAPMKYALERLKDRVTISIFDELDRI